MIVYIADKWIQDGLFINPGALAFSPISTYDVTGSEQVIPAPNILVVRVEVESLDAILLHPDYGVGAILYDEPNPYPPDGLPNAAEYGQRRAYFARLGVSNEQFRAMFGEPGSPHTRKVGADNCINWTKTLPKRKG